MCLQFHKYQLLDFFLFHYTRPETGISTMAARVIALDRYTGLGAIGESGLDFSSSSFNCQAGIVGGPVN